MNTYNELLQRQPICTVDLIIITLIQDVLKVLLIQRHHDAHEPFPGYWALPGGIIDTHIDTSLEDCARRKLIEKTGIQTPYLEQLGSWGNASRDPRGWSNTHVYLAVLPPTDLMEAQTRVSPDTQWFALSDIPTLAFDHQQILDAGLARLRGKSEYTSLPAYLLGETFTLTELQHMFERVLGRPLEKKSFRTRLLASEILEELNETKVTGRRPAQLFRLKERAGLHYFPRAIESNQT